MLSPALGAAAARATTLNPGAWRADRLLMQGAGVETVHQRGSGLPRIGATLELALLAARWLLLQR
jgi:hypothetical protein